MALGTAGASAKVIRAQKSAWGLHGVHGHLAGLPITSRTGTGFLFPFFPGQPKSDAGSPSLERDSGKLRVKISLERDPCSETRVTSRKAAGLWDQAVEQEQWYEKRMGKKQLQGHKDHQKETISQDVRKGTMTEISHSKDNKISP